jgi:tetratricopeptide (TPR) repeat protein
MHLLMDLATQSFSAGNWTEASGILWKLVTESPDAGRAWEMLALVHWRLGERDEALHCFETASSLVPLRPEAACGLAECYASTGHLNLALFMFESLAVDSRATVETLLTAAAGADSLNKPCISLRLCRAAMERDPDVARTYYELGYFLGRCGGPVSMIEAAGRKAVEMAPDQVMYRIGLASLLLKHRREGDAYEVVHELSEEQLSEVTCVCCLVKLANLFETMGDDRRAEWTRTRMLEIDLSDRDGSSIQEPTP